MHIQTSPALRLRCDDRREIGSRRRPSVEVFMSARTWSMWSPMLNIKSLDGMPVSRAQTIQCSAASTQMRYQQFGTVGMIAPGPRAREQNERGGSGSSSSAAFEGTTKRDRQCTHGWVAKRGVDEASAVRPLNRQTVSRRDKEALPSAAPGPCSRIEFGNARHYEIMGGAGGVTARSALIRSKYINPQSKFEVALAHPCPETTEISVQIGVDILTPALIEGKTSVTAPLDDAPVLDYGVRQTAHAEARSGVVFTPFSRHVSGLFLWEPRKGGVSVQRAQSVLSRRDLAPCSPRRRGKAEARPRNAQRPPTRTRSPSPFVAGQPSRIR
ncbi:uncharacterized protein MYCFIDRAFT_171324 [Pseudocercospora fijiensis CIRAD86]|uniref:Uncharacterized protein n=1 Tax=Pseudocercospora fijiensis (strain CIRAD86) TaxID=383855 RepID=M3ALD4_PSEFD|nr:uncharacterized protein MYCFIDRAFT_171324 [Pseudocercospora fijiensis CIRAD86]EME85396.1 hypothetical protein MYCFIDRAFT_171324 [Pseudocercospora fijiensis CIRAD86]